MRGVDFAYLSNWPTLFDSLATCLAACGGWHLLVPSIWHDYSNKLYWGAHVAVMRILVIHLYPFVGDFSQAWFPIAMVDDQGTYIIIYIYNYIYIYICILYWWVHKWRTPKNIEQRQCQYRNEVWNQLVFVASHVWDFAGQFTPHGRGTCDEYRLHGDSLWQFHGRSLGCECNGRENLQWHPVGLSLTWNWGAT